MAPFGLETFMIAAGVGLLILMVLYVAYAGTRRNTRGHNGRLSTLRGGRARRTGDPETGSGTAQPRESVDTLPRYTPGDEGGVNPPAQVHGSEEAGGTGEGEGEGVKPPPYTFDTNGLVVEGAGYEGDAGEWPRGGSHVGVPDRVHVSG